MKVEVGVKENTVPVFVGVFETVEVGVEVVLFVGVGVTDDVGVFVGATQ